MIELLAALRDDYDWYRRIHFRYPEQSHTEPILGVAEEQRERAYRILRWSGCAEEELDDIWASLEGASMVAEYNGREYGLGRLYKEDPRDRGFLATALPLEPADRNHYWAAGFNLNQGTTPECTAYSSATALMAAPYQHRDLPVRVDLETVYNNAKLLDEFPGTDYDGTTVRAICKAWQQLGFIAEYRWAETIGQVLSLLVNVGPVVIGSDWYEGMFEPDPASGLIAPSGKIAGGHAYCLIGYNHTRNLVRILNSWGRGWGQAGRAWMKVDDLTGLLAAQGEAAVLLDVPAAEFNKKHPILH